MLTGSQQEACGMAALVPGRSGDEEDLGHEIRDNWFLVLKDVFLLLA